MPSRLRIVLLVLCAVGIGGSIAQFATFRLEQRRLADFLRAVDLSDEMPGLAERVRRATSPMEARLRAIRPVVAYFLDPTWVFAIPQTDRLEAWERSLEALATVRHMARATMRSQPTSWEAPMVLGAATYMLHRGENLAATRSRMAEWEEPLRHAESLIPGYLEPTRYLAIAYVNHWQSLPADRRAVARETLARAFEDENTFRLVSDLWLRLVPDRKEALSIIPDRSFAWRKLREFFRRSGEWSLYLDSKQRYEASRRRELGALLDQAEVKLAGGDFRLATLDYHKAAARLPSDMANLELFRRLLAGMPPGPVGEHAERNLRRWLEWALPLCLLRRCPLESHELQRLLGLVGRSSLAEQATVEILAGRLAEAERIERRLPGERGAEWDGYSVLKAAELAERGEWSRAALTLRDVDPGRHRHPTYLAVRAEIASAGGNEGRARLAERALADLAATTWTPGEPADLGTIRLELLPERPASGLRLSFAELGRSPMPIEVSWNGGLVGTYLIGSGESLLVEVAVLPEPALLEVRADGQVRFGVERLRLADDS